MNHELSTSVHEAVAEITASLSGDVDVNEWSPRALTRAKDLLVTVSLVNGITEPTFQYWNGSQGSGKSTVTSALHVFAKQQNYSSFEHKRRLTIRTYAGKPVIMGTGGVMSSPRNEYTQLTEPIARKNAEMVRAGELAPDAFAIAAAALMTAVRLAEYGHSPDGYAGVYFDGFPRTVGQRDAWRTFCDDMFTEHSSTELMLVPVEEGFPVDQLMTEPYIQAARVFGGILKDYKKINVVSLLDQLDLNGTAHACRVFATGVAAISGRLAGQGGRIDANETSVAMRLGGFFQQTSDLWPHAHMVNSNQNVGGVVRDAMRILLPACVEDQQDNQIVGIVAQLAQLSVK